MHTNRQQLSAGNVLGDRYKIVRPLGQGGMAHVYLAEDIETHSYVALKIMRDELSDDPEFIRRFATEARAAASLDHPNIVAVLDYGQDEKVRYIVQEYVEGKTLKDLIREQGALDYRLAVPLTIQIGLALEHAHKRGVIHRDIKPQNVMITSDMVAKVTDFGIARTTSANTITLTGGIAFGSVHYFSPEQARGGHVTERSDLYSLGIILYEALTGELPFDGDSSVAVAIKQLQEMPEPPSKYIGSLPKALDKIVFKAIQKSPQNRYETVNSFVRELDSFMRNPEGNYGVIVGEPNKVKTSSALGAQNRSSSNFNKVYEVENSINKNKRSRIRDTAGSIIIALIAIGLLVAGFIFIYNRFMDSAQDEVEAFTLEDYTGRDIEAVVEELNEKYNLVLHEDIVIDWETSDITVGNIFDQKPEAKYKFTKGEDQLKFKVSAGAESSTVPDVVNFPRQEAENIMINAGYNVVIVEETSTQVSPDHVIRTVPMAGNTLPVGESVYLYISSEDENTTVPDLVGYRWNDAVQLLEQAGLTLGSASPIGQYLPEPERVIIIQNPSAYSEVKSGSTVAVTYGSVAEYNDFISPTEATTQSEEIGIPNLVGTTWDVALNLIQSWGYSAPSTISVQYISEASRNAAHHQTNPEDCYILEQSLSPGTLLDSSLELVFVLGTFDDYQNIISPDVDETVTGGESEPSVN
ncbi:MAG: Stk1 family PASTA domain-containing Ser/Thr kinase [Clostridiaceae bacterium]|nr:Stk1 family PASTA domain-containing Ser/Thr kinase [Clostridiaceae bacterium]